MPCSIPALRACYSTLIPRALQTTHAACINAKCHTARGFSLLYPTACLVSARQGDSSFLVTYRTHHLHAKFMWQKFFGHIHAHSRGRYQALQLAIKQTRFLSGKAVFLLLHSWLVKLKNRKHIPNVGEVCGFASPSSSQFHSCPGGVGLFFPQ